MTSHRRPPNHKIRTTILLAALTIYAVTFQVTPQFSHPNTVITFLMVPIATGIIAQSVAARFNIGRMVEVFTYALALHTILFVFITKTAPQKTIEAAAYATILLAPATLLCLGLGVMLAHTYLNEEQGPFQ